MNDKQNIEKLFQDAFEHFEPEVSSGVWNNVQSQIGNAPAPANDGGMASAGASTASGVTAGIAKIAAVVGIAGALVAGGYWLTSSDDSQETVATTESTVKEEPTATDEPLMSEEKPAQVTNDNIEYSEPVSPAEKATGIYTEKAEDPAPAASEKLHTSTDPGSQPAVTPQNNPDKQQAKATTHPGSTETATAKAEEEKKEVSRPLASINASLKKGRLPLLVRFSNYDASASQMSWDFGDGSPVSNTANPYHTFEKTGVYAVMLTVYGENGWVSHDTVQISVSPQLSLVIPSFLTPNGDGINETFKVEAENIDKFRCVITDRTGNIIYEMNNINAFWDGRDKMGNQASEGAYFYVIEYTTNDGYSDIDKGVLTLKR